MRCYDYIRSAYFSPLPVWFFQTVTLKTNCAKPPLKDIFSTGINSAAMEMYYFLRKGK